MSIITGVKIREDQRDFLDVNCINFSKFVRKCIDDLMTKS